ncbi:MAG: 3-methyl-2-oxobutanoate hydroxymethyltransferase, partial [Firmicutes bacterium]|nr:3-methyl-2-oxobutanoate hydroxymethyltransferase [Bacillota bacterium]
GQVLVTHDMLGFYGGHSPKFVRRFANLNDEITGALKNYKDEVVSGGFPGPEHGFTMSEEVLAKLKNTLY